MYRARQSGLLPNSMPQIMAVYKGWSLIRVTTHKGVYCTMMMHNMHTIWRVELTLGISEG